MIRINLLPHREEKKKQRRRDFGVRAVLSLIGAGLLVVLVGQFIDKMITDQKARNDYIRAENKKLDEQIKEIATLRQEIDALKARQQAVEDLQGDRNLPVHLLDELVKQTPEGVYLKQIKQEGLKVGVIGFAQSNERVSEYLRNLGNASQWLDSPELIEIKAAQVPVQGGARGQTATRGLFEFALNVSLKRPRSAEQPDTKKPGAPATAPRPGAPAPKTT
jgi:type IV pilus assembly protein PilN